METDTGDKDKQKSENESGKSESGPSGIKMIGGKVALAEFCWSALTAGRDPEAWNIITDNLLGQAAENAIEAGYAEPCRDSMRYIAEHCWKEGFLAAIAAMEYGVFEKMEYSLPKEPLPQGGNN